MNKIKNIGAMFTVVAFSVFSAFLVGGIVMGLSLKTPENSNKLYIYFSFFIGQTIILIPPIYYLNHKKRPILKSLRINKISYKTFQYVFIFSVGTMIIIDSLERIIQKIIPAPDYIITLGEIMQPETFLGALFLFLSIVIIAPIGEEILFRGFLQKFLEDYWNDVTKAILITSLFFAMIHFNPYWTIQIYLLGVILGFLSWKTKSVLPSIILHSLNNGVAFVLSSYNEASINYYLWNEFVSPIFIIFAIYLVYIGLSGINNSEPNYA